MAASVIRAKLDLAVRLYDTTTGATVDERNVVFLRDGVPVRPESRGAGVYVFINTGREDFLMQIDVFGYDRYETSVRYEELDERLPVCYVFLMPSENTIRGKYTLSFSGTLPFLKSIEAVNLNRSICVTGDHNTRTNVLSVFHPSGGMISLDEYIYGLLSADKTSYEKIEVEKMVTQKQVQLKIPANKAEGHSDEVPKKKEVPKIAPNLAIARIVHGIVQGEGKDTKYLIRVRDDGIDTRYLVRYEVEEEVRFQVVDFHDQEVLQ